ncbi:UDP-glycosyltransferase 89B2-like [Impatiens glandulifera]|uniref:UDP-glycosyltransferase 89B2-like n=1 Tax=Impatiens glandulifera TaxID=253017 RepID=UPI001FB12072|nr:UDP-glycosyltransferase 89B2-like [Impatiens glandulifera]
MAKSGDGGADKHIIVFSYPAPGHISPHINFSRLLISRGLKVTVILTPSYRQMLDPSDSINLLVLPVNDSPVTADFPFFTKMRGLRELHNPIVDWFKVQKSPPIAIVSDAFLGWTHHLADQLSIPRLAFYTSGVSDSLVSYLLWRDMPEKDTSPEDDLLVSFPTAPNCPKYHWWQIGHLYKDYKEGDPDCEAFRDGMLNNLLAWGIIFNSFTELEGVYIDHVKKLAGHDRVWAVGPLLSPDHGLRLRLGEDLSAWLDDKPENSVVYICFGSHFMLTKEQMEDLAGALCWSEVHFIWVVNDRIKGQEEIGYGEIPVGLEDTVGSKGFVIRGWAPQVAILRHRAVGTFLTHCGWNSVMEGLMEGVVMLTWPIDGDQFTNAKLLVDQLGVAVQACEGGIRCRPDLTKLVPLLFESVTKNQPERARVREMQAAAKRVAKGSSGSLDQLVNQIKEFNI